MGLMTSAILTMTAVQGVSQIMSGVYADREAKANAALSDVNAARLAQQAGMIEQQKKLQAAQDDRAINFIMGATIAAAASKGLQLSGSPIAIMMDTRTQLEMDKAIGQYNLDVEKRRVLTESRLTSLKSRMIRARGKSARTAGVVGGISTLLKGAVAASSGFDKKYVSIGGKKTLVAPADYYLRASKA